MPREHGRHLGLIKAQQALLALPSISHLVRLRFNFNQTFGRALPNQQLAQAQHHACEPSLLGVQSGTTCEPLRITRARHAELPELGSIKPIYFREGCTHAV